MAYDQKDLDALDKAVNLGTRTAALLRKFIRWRDTGKDEEATLSLTQDQITQLQSDYQRTLTAYKTAVSELTVPN